MDKKRRVTMHAAFGAILALFFLPALLCVPPVLRTAQRLINNQLPGTFEVQSCSLGWWQGLRCRDLKYQDPEEGVQVTAPRLTGDKGLFALLAAPSYLGEITIDQPLLSFFPKAAAGEKTAQDAGAPAPSDRQTVMAKQGGSGQAPWWERLALRLKVNKGLVMLDHGRGPGQELARDIDLNGSLVGGTINYALAFQSGPEQQGQLRAEGFINLPTASQSPLETLISRTDVEIKGLEIAAFLDLAASRGNFPRGEGVLDATCHLITAGIEGLELQGETGLRGLRLSGAFLGQDQPVVDHLQFKFKGNHSGQEGWRLDTLHLQSDPVWIEANGSYNHAVASLTAKGAVNLPAVAVQLPHLLALQEKTTFKEGLVDFSLNVSGTPRDLAMKADCRTGHLVVVHDTRYFSWDAPLSLVAEADRHQDKTTIRTLHAHMPFFDAQGSGGTDDFSFRATADLDRMFQELDKIFALDFHGKGQAEITGSSQVREEGGYRLDTRIGIGNFSLSRGKTPVLQPHDFLLTGEALATPSFFQDGILTTVQLDGVSWPGKLSFRGSDTERKIGQSYACAVQGAIDLEKLSAFYWGIAGTTPSFNLKGDLSFAGSGGWRENQLSLSALEGTINRLTVSGERYFQKEPRVIVSLANRAATGSNPVAVRDLQVAENWPDFSEKEQPVFHVDFQRHQFEVRHLTITTADATVRGNLFLGDWHQARRDVAAEISGESDAALLTTLFKAGSWFPEDMALKGRARTSLKVSASREQEGSADLAVQVEPFELFRAKKKVVSDPRLGLSATLQGDIVGDGAMKISAFALQTTPLQVEGTGLIQRSAPATLELQGALTPDLPYLSKLLVSAIGRKVALTGKRQGNFLLSCPLKLPLDEKSITLAARLTVDSFQFQGIGLKQLDIPLEINRGKLGIFIGGEMNGGNVSLQPQWDFGDHQSIVTLPSSSQILKNVSLQQPMIDGMLLPMHPLFGVLARPVGSVDLRLDNVTWPLVAKKGQPIFTATMGLGKIRFKATKGLREILDLGGFSQEPLSLKETELTCTCRDGRINCPPVHLLAGEAEIAISGSVGMDRTLDYRIQLPVTASLAAKVQLPMQEGGGAVKATIAGTLDRPSFDQRAFLELVTNQLRQAVSKEPEPQVKQPAQGKPSAAGS